MRNGQKWGNLKSGGMGREERKAKKYDQKLSPHESDQSENPNDSVIKGLLRISISYYQFNINVTNHLLSSPMLL